MDMLRLDLKQSIVVNWYRNIEKVEMIRKYSYNDSHLALRCRSGVLYILPQNMYERSGGCGYFTEL